MKKFLDYFLFWFLSLTWGIVMSSIGLIVSLALLITGHRPKKFGFSFYFEVGENWGGLELGCIFIVNKNPSEDLLYHESGHTIQNTYLGPLFPFLIGIPSAIRYWLREKKTLEKKYSFALMVCLIPEAVSVDILITVGFLQIYNILNLTLFIFGVFLFIYSGCVSIWLIDKEVPQYKDNYPDYDAIWFEGNATKTGKRFFLAKNSPQK